MFLFKLERAGDLFLILKNYWDAAEARRHRLLTNNPNLITTNNAAGRTTAGHTPAGRPVCKYLPK